MPCKHPYLFHCAMLQVLLFGFIGTYILVWNLSMTVSLAQFCLVCCWMFKFSYQLRRTCTWMPSRSTPIVCVRNGLSLSLSLPLSLSVIEYPDKTQDTVTVSKTESARCYWKQSYGVATISHNDTSLFLRNKFANLYIFQACEIVRPDEIYKKKITSIKYS